MKKYLLLAIIGLAYQTTFYAQKQTRVKGNREVVASERVFDSIVGIEIHQDIVLNVFQGTENKLQIEADENLHKIVLTTLTNGNLDIDLTNKITSKKKFELTLFVKELNQITLNDESVLKISDFLTADQLTVSLNDKSEIIALIDAKNVVLQAQDNTASDLVLKSEQATVNMEDNAKLKIESDVLNFIIKGSQKSTLILKGKAKNLDISAENSTEIKASNLTTETVSLKTEDYTEAFVNATKQVTIEAAGHSKIHIFGKPKIALKLFEDNAILYKE